ncbi:hypothetical protein BCR42DRAFT_407111 [Absidia repens]|uniref:HIT-type domain-containing protein n=1 Tax=Absidia repens TaxID=90262 RepID=A0A1X2ITC9_9FUNG|nr:hypothetical protein BCR42DRAFT_407111 [Absidia repens]
MDLCRICHVNAPKYKCSTCILPYCSLACYKTHKETPCQSPAPKQSQVETKNSQKQTPIEDDDEDETRLTTEQLQQLGSCEQIRSFLDYPQIRDLVTKIDAAPQPDKLLDAVRKEDSVFEDFVQTLLKSTNTNQ